MRDAVLGGLGTRRRTPRVIAGLPLLLWTVPLVVTLVLLGPAGVLSPPVLMAMGIHGLWVVGQVYGGYRLHRKPLEADRYRRLLAWFFGLAIGFFLINVVVLLAGNEFTLVETLGWLVMSWNMGSGIGLLVGFIEARAIDRAVTAERAATESDLLAEQRDRFAYMNAILRHEVLNNVQVVRGQAEYLLGADPDPETAGHLEIISRQSQDMVDVVQDIRTVSQGLEDAALRSVDLRSVLRTELVDLRDTYDDVETELTCPDDVHVVADELLDRVFSNLFANAVEHNEGVAHVAVTVEVVPDAALDSSTTVGADGPTGGENDAVVITIADDGTGVPEVVRRSLFDHDRGPHGVGLYLVDTLVSHYGGDVELVETGSDGTVFTVTLRRASTNGRSREDAAGTDVSATDVTAFEESTGPVADASEGPGTIPDRGEVDPTVEQPREDRPSVSRPSFDGSPAADGED